MAPRWRRSLPPCPKINLKRRANSRFHLNANPKIETEWFLDARTVILGLEIPRNLVESLGVFRTFYESLSFSLSYVERGITFLVFSFSPFVFQKRPCFRRNLYSREDNACIDEEEVFNFESRQLSSYETLSGRNDIEALFARSKLFILASLIG